MSSFVIKTLRISNATYFVAVGITLLSNKLGWFTLHPFLMCITWICASEGVASFSLPRAGIKRHMPFMFASYLIALLGFAVIYLVKESNGKAHFVTTHGYYGAISAAMLVMMGFGTGMAKNVFNLKSRLYWRIHRLGGVSLMLGVWTVSYLHMGTPTGWFTRNADPSYSFGGLISFGLAGLSCLVVMILSK